LADVSRAALDQAGEEFGVARRFTKFRDLLACSDVEAVDVCLHNNFHMPVTVAALEAGKHVYCEKPMAGTYADAATMLAAAQKTGRQLHIQLSTLYSNETKAAKYLIDRGSLGNLYYARSTGFRRRGRPYVDGYGTPTFVQKRNSAGGALYDMGVYHIAQCLYLLGNPAVARISGRTFQEIEMDEKRRAASGYDVEELGMGFVRFTNKLVLDMIEAWAIHLDNFESSVVVGASGGVRLQPFGFYRNEGDLALNSAVDMDQFMFRLHNVHGVGNEYDTSQHHWVAALQGRVPLISTAEIALNTMLISEGIYLADKLGREVAADEVRQQSVSTAVQV
jgi:predicted dehydrogenase